jgi:hypothetical protein
LAAVNKRLENVLLGIQVAVGDRGELVAQGRKMLDFLVDTIVVDVVARRLGAEDDVVAHVVLDKAVVVVSADDRVGQVDVLDLGLQLAAVMLGDFAAEDDGDLVRLTDGAVGVEETLTQLVERGATVKDQVVAVLDLREE